jgi:hypothetical protein
VNLRKIGVMTTIVVSFIEAVTGSMTGALVFWLALFSAAAANSPADQKTAELDRRWM